MDGKSQFMQEIISLDQFNGFLNGIFWASWNILKTHRKQWQKHLRIFTTTGVKLTRFPLKSNG